MVVISSFHDPSRARFKVSERTVPTLLNLTFPVDQNATLFNVKFVSPGTPVMIHSKYDLHSTVYLPKATRSKIISVPHGCTGVGPLLPQRPESFNYRINELIKTA